MNNFFGFLPKDKKQWKVFLICVGIATMFWMIRSFSESYQQSIVFELTYDLELPDNQYVLKSGPNQFRVEIKAKGLDLLKTTSSKRKRSVHLNIDDFEYYQRGSQRIAYFLPQKNAHFFATKISNQAEVRAFEADSILIILDSLVTKKVHLEAVLNVQYDSSLYVLLPPKLIPNNLTITGANSIMAKIIKLKIDFPPVILENHTKKIGVSIPQFYGIASTHPDSVYVQLELEDLKKHQLKIPIQCKNCLPNQQIKLFPSQAELTFYCGTKQFKQISEKDFKLTVDYQQIKEGDKLTVNVERFPEFIKEFQLYPAKVTYIQQN